MHGVRSWLHTTPHQTGAIPAFSMILHLSEIAVSQVAVFILFCFSCFFTVVLAVVVLAAPARLQNRHEVFLDLFWWLDVVFGIAVLTFFTENVPLNPHAKRWESYHAYLLIIGFLFVFAFVFRKRRSSDAPEILNREQAEEWKGWMQILFIMYHYLHCMEAYGLNRVFVSAYVWLTGFGNYTFFRDKQDFSLLRLWNMLWRLNFAGFLLMAVQNTSYMLYYVMPLHTFYFLMVYAVCSIRVWFSSDSIFQTYKIFQNFNHVKLLLTCVLIACLWDIPGAYNFIAGRLLGLSLDHSYDIANEFHFRTYLDHYSTLYGMLFALLFPSLKCITEYCQSFAKGRSWVLVSGFAGVFAAWGLLLHSVDRYSYNTVHPYVSIFPIVAFIFLRNSLGAGAYFVPIFAFFGRISLESYLLQHHLLLTSNAKTLLVAVPFSYYLNFVFCWAVFVGASYVLCMGTMELRSIFIPRCGWEALKRFSFATIFLACVIPQAIIIKGSVYADGPLSVDSLVGAYGTPLMVSTIVTTVLFVSVVLVYHYSLRPSPATELGLNVHEKVVEASVTCFGMRKETESKLWFALAIVFAIASLCLCAILPHVLGFILPHVEVPPIVPPNKKFQVGSWTDPLGAAFTLGIMAVAMGLCQLAKLQ